MLDTGAGHGPAFGALTELQQRYVLASLQLGGRNDAEAVRIAGYDTKYPDQMGYSLKRNPKIIEALREEAERRLTGGAMLAASALVAIVLNPLHKDHYKASVELLNRSGLEHIQKIEVNHSDNRGRDELIKDIVRMALDQKMDPSKLLGYDPFKKGEVVEAEFTEVVMSDEERRELFGDDDSEAASNDEE